MNIAFIVLHYGAIEETYKCIKSIREKIDTELYKIIIVDNCSPDNSYTELVEKYGEDKDIEIIHNNENIGFARGNNVGYQRAKKKYSPDYIVLMNNDIILLQNNVFNKIKQLYEKYRFAVLGPLIVSGDGRILSNPMRKSLLTLDGVERAKKRYKRLIRLNRVGLDNLYQNIMRIVHPYVPSISVEERIRNQLDVGLHGSFLVFSKEYIERFDGLDPRTFLYFEEDILYLHMLQENLHTLYTPEVCVFHSEDASTNAVCANSRKKNEFVYKNRLASLLVYETVYREKETETYGE